MSKEGFSYRADRKASLEIKSLHAIIDKRLAMSRLLESLALISRCSDRIGAGKIGGRNGEVSNLLQSIYQILQCSETLF